MKNITKCHNADKYKATREPKCQCFACQTKWKIAELEKSNKELIALLKENERLAGSASSAANAALYVSNYCR